MGWGKPCAGVDCDCCANCSNGKPPICADGTFATCSGKSWVCGDSSTPACFTHYPSPVCEPAACNNGTAPKFIGIQFPAIAAIGDGSCGDCCAGYSGLFVILSPASVSLFSCDSNICCGWSGAGGVSFPPCIGGTCGDVVDAAFFDSGVFAIRVTGGNLVWRKTGITTPTNCQITLDGLVVPFFFGNAPCTQTPGSCTVFVL
jgi:hypothetical protein